MPTALPAEPLAFGYMLETDSILTLPAYTAGQQQVNKAGGYSRAAPVHPGGSLPGTLGPSSCFTARWLLASRLPEPFLGDTGMGAGGGGG